MVRPGTNPEPRQALSQAGEQATVAAMPREVSETGRVDDGQWDAEPEEQDVTPEQDEILRDIQAQLRGPGLIGWPQLGDDEHGQHRSLVEALAAALTRIDELRTEVSDLEATVAELGAEVARLSKHDWPFPFSLIESAAMAVAEHMAKLERLLPDVSLPGPGPAPEGRSGTTPAPKGGKLP